MALKSTLINLIAPRIKSQTHKQARSAVRDQEKWLQKLISSASATRFGKDHTFSQIKTADDYKKSVPIRDYEALRPYVDEIIAGASDVLWPGRPKYFAKTSGTTSGVKYIPISSDSIGYHIAAARNTILNFTAQRKAKIFDGKMIFVSGSPVLETKGGIQTGRLSGIVNHEIPSWAQSNQLPSYATNCIEEWEDKLDSIVEETYNQDLRLISGIPPWVQMYYERLLAKTGKSTIKEVFPNLAVFIHGGVNYAPYKASMDAFHGGDVTTLETYPASEGFIAYQDDYSADNLLLNTNAGMYFEFVPLQELGQAEPQRLSLAEVALNQDYALLISSNAGLWAYDIGDTIRFVSLDPYKIKVSGRVKHYISAFGEHVIAKEVEEAMSKVSQAMGFAVREFTVAPQITPAGGGLPHHEWLIEWTTAPSDLTQVATALDAEICTQNIYYKDLIDGQILKPLILTTLREDSFRDHMRSLGKLGGQNKVPRLTNDRIIADNLLTISNKET